MYRPSIYYSLIYYRRIKLLEHITLALLVVFMITTLISKIYYLWKKYVSDVIIVGSGGYTGYFQSLLQEADVTSRLILPRREHQLSFPIQNTSSWSRPGSTELVFPSPNQEELEELSNKFDVPLENVTAAWDEISQEAKLYPSHDTFFSYAENLGTEQRSVYSYPLKEYYGEREHIIDITQEAGLATVTLRDGKKLYGRYAFLVETNHEELIEKYYNLNHPLGARISQNYLSQPDDDVEVGSYFESDGVSFCYYRDDKLGLTRLSTDVPVSFNDITGKYQVEIPECSLTGTLELYDLPSCQSRVDYLFFSWQLKEKSPVILDRLTIKSSSPSRDLLIIIKAISKMLTNFSKSQLALNGDIRSSQ